MNERVGKDNPVEFIDAFVELLPVLITNKNLSTFLNLGQRGPVFYLNYTDAIFVYLPSQVTLKKLNTCENIVDLEQREFIGKDKLVQFILLLWFFLLF